MTIENILIYLFASTILFLIIFFNARIRKNNKNYKSIIFNLEKKNLIQIENQRVLDSINLLFENNNDPRQNLCNSIRIASDSNTVILSEMNTQNGSFQVTNFSSSSSIDISNFSPEYDEDKTLAIITGIEGTSKVLDYDQNKIFPKWFDELDYKQIISIPIIKGFQTYGCIYIFFSEKNEGKILEKKLNHSNIITKIFQNLFKENNQVPDEKKAPEEIVAKNNVIPIIYDDNLQTIRFENSEISLSNSEYLILKNLIGKNGELLPYEDIEKILWPNNDGVNKSAMRLHIHRLREKTNTITNHIDFIKTVRGKGIFIDSSLF